jgi:flagellar L-ring protein precursor FlgH
MFVSSCVRLSIVALLAAALAGCNAADRISNIGKAPDFSPMAAPVTSVAMPMPAPEEIVYQPNSLWRSGSRAFFRDQRAARVGDILTVLINVEDSAKVNNTTTRSRSNSENAGVNNLFGYESYLGKVFPDAVDKTKLADLESTSDSEGKGSVDRKETIDLTVAAVVTQVLPNGNLVIGGRQQVRVNYEVRDLLEHQHRSAHADRRSPHFLWRRRSDQRHAAAALRPAALRHHHALLTAQHQRRKMENAAPRKRPRFSILQRDEAASIVAINLLAPFVTLLRLDRQRRDRARIEPLQADRLAGLFAIAVGAVLDPAQRRVDLGDKLALAVARSEFKRAFGLGRSAVGEIRMLNRVVLQMLQRLPVLDQDVLFPLLQLAAEIFLLPLVHERLVVGGHVTFGQTYGHLRNLSLTPLVRFRHLPPWARMVASKCQAQGTVGKSMKPVELLNVTFEDWLCRCRNSNVKFAPLAPAEARRSIGTPSTILNRPAQAKPVKYL